MADYFGGDGAAFLRSRHEGLRSVNLVGSVASQVDAVALAIAQLSLEELTLSETDLGPAQMRTLAPALRSLTSLRISESRIEDEGLVALADAGLPGITTLTLRRCGIRGPGVEALVRSSGFANLSALHIQGDHPTWPRSSRTDVYPHSNIGPGGAAALSAWEHPLTRLELNGNRIGDDGAMALAAWRCKPEHLELKTNRIGPAGAKAFAENDPGRMFALDLQSNRIGKEGVAALAESPFLSKFRYLGLTTNEVSSDRVVDYTDWDGTVVSSGFEEMKAGEIRDKFGFPPTVRIV